MDILQRSAFSRRHQLSAQIVAGSDHTGRQVSRVGARDKFLVSSLVLNLIQEQDRRKQSWLSHLKLDYWNLIIFIPLFTC